MISTKEYGWIPVDMTLVESKSATVEDKPNIYIYRIADSETLMLDKYSTSEWIGRGQEIEVTQKWELLN